MELEHISRQSFFRYPVGAICAKAGVRLRLSVKNAGIPRSVRVFYKCEGGEETYADMPYVFSVMDMSVYVKELVMPEKPCLVW